MSPDLNPIENLWSMVKKRVRAIGPFKNITELREAARVCWDGFRQEELLSLTRSIPNRISQAIASKDGHIGY